MTGKVHTISKVIAKAEAAATLKSLLIEVAELSRQEPGCLRYELWQGTANPLEFIGIGEWVDDAAFQTHYRSGYMDELIREIPELVEHPPDVQWYRVVL
ncbi:MAG TPA: antibiotic biosynthesis monooxygenase [Leptolyngbyaceae cyanobacterium M65_K2018_010]|nr:antibiotic biosynthesis monooxygenase [Leptolyngbyaceae cyanobacterium M65_K2018_010]